LIGNFAYVFTRVESRTGSEYDLEITEIPKLPTLPNLAGEELTLELVAGRKITFTVQGRDGDRLRVVVLGPPSEGNTERV
jgi:hypothetical protein